MNTTTVVTGAVALLPGADTLSALVEGPASGAAPVAPADLVGRKGLRYKDRATQLGYCLAAAALRDAGLLDKDGLMVSAGTTGTVVSSNFGNLSTVTGTLDTIRAETVTGTSPMDLPNASSNVIASSVAIRYGLRGPNFMLCNGETSGLDAVRWAAVAIAAGRADRMLVLGVEPDDEVGRRLLDGGHAVDGGAALVLESEDAAAARGSVARARVGRYTRAAGEPAVRRRLSAGLADGVVADAPQLPEHSGRASGALGVIQLAAAVGLFDGGADVPVRALAGTATDGAVAGMLLHAPGAA